MASGVESMAYALAPAIGSLQHWCAPHVYRRKPVSLTVKLVLSVGDVVRSLALLVAFGRRVQILRALGIVGLVAVMLAVGEWIWTAAGLGRVVRASDDAVVHPVLPRTSDVATFTAPSAVGTAAQQIVGRNGHLKRIGESVHRNRDWPTLTVPLLAMQMRSEIASTAPNAQQLPQAD